MPASLVVARARSLIGTRFRLHGRDPEHGLDCVGMIAHVFDRATEAPNGYALRNSDGARWIALIDKMAERRTDANAAAGDIILMQVGPAQYHFGLFTGDGLIHADARLRRVVETLGPIQWPVIATWLAPKETF